MLRTMWKTSLWATALLMSIASSVQGQTSTKPNIIFIFADDMGWNDVSFHGSDAIPTPNIDALAFHGVVLNRHYVQPMCTPSRVALLTGKYPIRTGMQGTPIVEHEARGLEQGPLLSNHLKDLGYVTRAIGKWNLGFHIKEYLPTYRGFDSHLGHWGGAIGYYDHNAQVFTDDKELHGYHVWDNLTAGYKHSGKYITDVYTEEAERLILEHDPSKPLFMYLAHQACHHGIEGSVITAPPELVAKFEYISEPNRRIYAAVVTKLDESVGRVVAALEKRGILDNTIIVFSSDNGAPSEGMTQNWGSNYPLRGLKATLYEGGVRATALVWSPLLENTPRVSNQLMHITDWLPTLYTAAGGDLASLPDDLDGINFWDALKSGSESPRTEILLNVDEKVGNAAIRVGDWKLVRGIQIQSDKTNYYGASGDEDPLFTPAYDPLQVLSSAAGQAVSNVQGNITAPEDILQLRAEATVSCPNRPSTPACTPNTTEEYCVYNIIEDPCEAGESVTDQEVVAMLLERLEALSQPMKPQEDLNEQPDLSDPAQWNHTWVPWTDCLTDSSQSFCTIVRPVPGQS